MANERLFQFPSKAAPTPADILFVGNAAVGFDEVQSTIAQVISAYPTLTAFGGLTLAANGVFTTNSLGVPVMSVGGQIPGTTTNNSANVGNVGEVLSNTVIQSAAISIPTTNTPQDVTSMLLQPGDYDLWGNSTIIYTSGAYTSFSTWVSSSSSTLIDLSQTAILSGISMGGNIGLNAPTQPIKVLIPTTYYLSINTVFVTASIAVCGQIFARRRR